MNSFIEKIDRIPEETWQYIILNSNDFIWNFFAIKIILTRLNLKLKMFPNNPLLMEQCCAELRELLKKSVNVPNAQKDMKLIASLAGDDLEMTEH